MCRGRVDYILSLFHSLFVGAGPQDPAASRAYTRGASRLRFSDRSHRTNERGAREESIEGRALFPIPSMIIIRRSVESAASFSTQVDSGFVAKNDARSEVEDPSRITCGAHFVRSFLLFVRFFSHGQRFVKRRLVDRAGEDRQVAISGAREH